MCSSELNNRENGEERPWPATCTVDDLAALYGGVSVGIELGRRRDNNQLVYQFNEDRYRHTVVAGNRSPCKSAYLLSLVCQDMHNDADTVVVATDREAALDVLRRVPERRVDEVLFLDFGNPGFTPFLNPLAIDGCDKGAVADVAEDIAKLVVSAAACGYMSSTLRNLVRMTARLVIHSVCIEERTLASMYWCLEDPSYRNCLIEACSDKELKKYWSVEFPKLLSDGRCEILIASVKRQLGYFAVEPSLRGLFGGRARTIDIPKAVAKRGVVVFLIPEGCATEAGSLLYDWLLIEVERGLTSRRQSPRSRKETVIYLDACERASSAQVKAVLAASCVQHVMAVLSFDRLARLHVEGHKAKPSRKEPENLFPDLAGSFICFSLVRDVDVELASSRLDIEREKVAQILSLFPLVVASLEGKTQVLGPCRCTRDMHSVNPVLPAVFSAQMVGAGIWRARSRRARHDIDPIVSYLGDGADSRAEQVARTVAEASVKQAEGIYEEEEVLHHGL